MRVPLRPPGGGRRHGINGCRGNRLRNRLERPPVGRLSRDFLPAIDRAGLAGIAVDAERNQHLLERAAAVIAHLLRRIANPLGPGQDDLVAGEHHALAQDPHLADPDWLGRRLEALGLGIRLHQRHVVIQHMAMVAREDHQSPGFPGGLQDLPQHANRRHRPAHGHLGAAAQLVVDRVDHRADDLVRLARDDFPYPFGQGATARLLEIDLVKQQGRKLRRRKRLQSGMRGECLLLIGTAALAQRSGQQGKAADLRDRWQGGEQTAGGGAIRRLQLHPAVVQQIARELAVDGMTHPIEHQDQHRLLLRQGGDQAIQRPLHRQDRRIDLVAPRDGRQMVREALVQPLAPRAET